MEVINFLCESYKCFELNNINICWVHLKVLRSRIGYKTNFVLQIIKVQLDMSNITVNIFNLTWIQGTSYEIF